MFFIHFIACWVFAETEQDKKMESLLLLMPDVEASCEAFMSWKPLLPKNNLFFGIFPEMRFRGLDPQNISSFPFSSMGSSMSFSAEKTEREKKERVT